MKPKTIILMVVAIVCGLGAAYMTSNLLAQRQTRSAPGISKVKVLYAKKDLEIGISLQKKNLTRYFAVKEVIKGNQPPGAVTSYKQLDKKFLNRHLLKGDMVRRKDLVDDMQNLKLPGGKRAYSLTVNLEKSVAGFATVPGNHVDIVWYHRASGNDGRKAYYLLQDVLVLAAGQKSTREDDRNSIVTNVVTMALTPQQVLAAEVAEQNGTLKLILRRPDDETRENGGGMSLTQLLKSVSKKQKKKKVAPPSVAKADPEPKKKPDEKKVAPPPPPTDFPWLVEIKEGSRTRTKVYRMDKAGKIVRKKARPAANPQPIPFSDEDPLQPEVNPTPPAEGEEAPARPEPTPGLQDTSAH